MAVIKLVHGSDFHIDEPFMPLNYEKAEHLRKEQDEIISSFCNTVNAIKPDAVLLAGDMFSNDAIGMKSACSFRDMLSGINSKIFVAPGRDDFYSEASPYRCIKWPDNVYIFRRPEIEGVDIGGLTVYGAAFVSERQQVPFLNGFSNGMQPAVGVFYGEYREKSMYNCIRNDDLLRCGIDYIALGGSHTFSKGMKLGRTTACYSGAICSRSFQDAGKNGIVYSNIDDSGNTEIKLIPMQKHRYLSLSADLSEAYEKDVTERLIRTLPEKTEGDIIRLCADLRGCYTVDEKRLKSFLDNRCFFAQIDIKNECADYIWECSSGSAAEVCCMRQLKKCWSSAQNEETRRSAVYAAELIHRLTKNNDWREDSV